MPNHKSAEKRLRQSEKRYVRNKPYRTRLKNVLKYARTTLKSTVSGEELKQVMHDTEKIIRKIKSKGIIHKNKASRLISRLYKMHKIVESSTKE